MAKTLYATFEDRAHAVQAAGALLDHGADKGDISVISHVTEDEFSRREREPEFTHHELFAGRWAEPREPDAPLDATQTQRHPTTGQPAGGTNPPGGPVHGPDDTVVRRADEAHEPLPADRDRDEPVGDADEQAKEGYSTTTGADAAAGAGKGAAWGLGAGALAALAALFLPGVGLVLGGGALATALGGVAGATAAGAVAGGVHGYLVDQGVDEDVARRYGESIAGGGALVELRVPSGKLDLAEARELLTKYGALNVDDHGSNGVA